GDIGARREVGSGNLPHAEKSSAEHHHRLDRASLHADCTASKAYRDGAGSGWCIRADADNGGGIQFGQRTPVKRLGATRGTCFTRLAWATLVAFVPLGFGAASSPRLSAALPVLLPPPPPRPRGLHLGGYTGGWSPGPQGPARVREACRGAR